MDEVREEGRHGHHYCGQPVDGGRGDLLGEDVVDVPRVGRGEGAVEVEEGVPGEDAAPDEEVADPGEVGDHQGDLAVDGPDYARVRGGPHVLDVPRVPVRVERGWGEGADGEGEDDEGGYDGVGDPPDDSFPAEAGVLLALLVECWELQYFWAILLS